MPSFWYSLIGGTNRVPYKCSLVRKFILYITYVYIDSFERHTLATKQVHGRGKY